MVQRAAAAQGQRLGELGALRGDHTDRLGLDHFRHLQKKTQSAEDADWVPSL
ncbi:hypothetical protein [Thauera humireducens]|uniref:hypothetical protein n=1 Tax=Thauera humireducens TaxID=1134435 RepID=UPI00311DB450